LIKAVSLATPIDFNELSRRQKGFPFIIF